MQCQGVLVTNGMAVAVFLHSPHLRHFWVGTVWILCFFLYLEIFGWEQLKKAPCKWSKSWWKRPKKVGQGLQSPLLSNARNKVFLWGGVSLYCNIWNTTYFTRQSNGRCSSKSRFRLHIVQGLRTKEISPTSPLRFVLITCISFSNINHILLRKNLFSSRMSRCN